MNPPGTKRPRVLLSDAALAEQASHCGRMLEMAMGAGDRDLALVWQAAMFGVAKLRRRRSSTDTQHKKD